MEIPFRGVLPVRDDDRPANLQFPADVQVQLQRNLVTVEFPQIRGQVN